MTLILVVAAGSARASGDPRLDVLADVESQAITMIKDRDGFLWIGTYVDGVYRYDGKRLQHYTQTSGMILANSVPAILEDGGGNIWFAAGGGGLTRFDKETNRITAFSHNPEDPGSLSSNSFFWAGKLIMTEGRGGALWIGTNGGGLNRFDPSTETFTHYRHDPDNPQSLSNDNIRVVLEDRYGMIWIGTGSGLNRLDPETGTLTRYLPGQGPSDSLSGPIVMSLFEDSDGTVWAGTESNGLNRFDPETGSFVHYRYDPDDEGTIESDRIIDIFEDRHGTLWLSHQKGLTFLDRETGTFRRWKSVHTDITKTIGDPATGRIWLLTDSGKLGLIEKKERRFQLFKPDPEDPNTLSSEIVVTIYEDSRGLLWIGTLGGLHRYDPETGEFTVYKHEPGNPRSIPSTMDYVPGIFEDGGGTLWLGSSTPATLSIFDRDTGTVAKTYRHQPGNPFSLPNAQQINRIIEDPGDSMVFWMATAKGLVKFDWRTERFITYGHDNSWAVYEDPKGRLWISTWGNGLGRFDKGTGKLTYHRHDPRDPTTISDNTLVPIFADSKNRMWVGTENGLNRFDPDSGRFQRFTRKNGYPWDAIHSIGEDREGRLWLGTNNGLARLDPETGRFRHYTREDGIQGAMFYANNGIMTRDGRMWFGGTKGMNSFFPERVKDNPHIPPVRLTSISQGGVETDFGRAPERLTAITLDWRHNFFEFEFAALDYTNPGQNQYAYRLQGVDKDWYASGSRNFGRYAGLAPGTYTLRLRGSNNDGVWNDEGQALRITVLPPFWRTGWFYTLVIAMVLSMIGAAVFYMIRLNREIFERKKAEIGLKHSNERLESLNRELKRLDQLKDEFLANTSHELRTPLVGIIGLAESLVDGATGPLAPKTVANLSMIAASGRRLANLVNDILDFSKLRHRDINLCIAPVDMHTATDVVIAITQPLLEGKNLKLLNLIAPDAPLAAADENRVQQILFNLVGNAVKFTEAGMVSVSAETPADGLVEICVSDTGIGIPEDCLDSVFASFEQVDGSIEREYGGTGLGLAVTRQLVELHGGTVRVVSETDKGSQFYFTLPVAEGVQGPANTSEKVEGIRTVEANGFPYPEDPAGNRPVAEGEDETEAIPEDAPNILVVDDEPVNLQVLANHLSLHRYHVTRAADGIEALTIIDRMATDGRQFDLVLLDVMMPRMSGYEVCRRLRENYSADRLPVVMLTAKNRIEDLVTGLEAGANDYLTKPFSKSELLARIKNHSVMKYLSDERQKNQQALLESEKKYRELFEAIPDVVYRLDMEGRLIMISPAVTKILGYGVEEILGASISDKLYMEPKQRAELLERIKIHGPVKDTEIALKHRDGRAVWVALSANFFRDEKGAILGVEGIFRDITRETALENQLVQAQKMESIGTLAGGIAHDFNNILSAIIGYTEISIHDTAETEVRGNLAKVLKAGERARDLVNQILTFSRQDNVEPRPVKVRLIIKEALKLLRASLPATIDIETDIRSDGMVMADPTRIHQVLMNMCTNAAHAMGKAGGTLRVGLHDPADPKTVEGQGTSQPWVRLTIEDTGRGIDPSIIERIFDPFFTTKEKGEGTGMGLSVVHGIVTGCGGRIDVSSRPGMGTTFRVFLPAIQDVSETVEPPEEALVFGNERILLVDDESFQVDLGRQILERLGYRVVTETASTAALERFRSHPEAFDLVITDMTMPGMPGDQLARELLAVRPGLPIILCTGYSEHITQERAALLGIRGFAMKPIVMKDIAKLIREVLGETQARS